MRNNYFEDIAFTSLKEELGNLSTSSLKRDFMAALTVVFLTIPQTLAYSLVAGLPLSSALYSAIFSAAIASLLGSSRHLIVGPSNAIAIMLQAGLADVMQNYRDVSGLEREAIVIGILTQLSLLVALFQGAFAFFKLGRLTNFVSHSVIIGYLMGVTFAVIVAQIYVFMGIPTPEGDLTVYEKARALISGLKETHFSTSVIGLLSLITLIGIKKWDSKLPAGAIMIFFISLFLVLEKLLITFGSPELNLAEDDLFKVATIADTEMLTNFSFHITIPEINLKVFNQLLSFSFAISLISILESTSIARSIAASSGERLSVNQTTLGLAAGNLVSAMTGGMPISGSPTRSILNYTSGATSRFSALFGCLILAVIMSLAFNVVGYIPLASLAALMIVTTPRIIDSGQLRLCLKATRGDAVVLWITFVSCLFFDLNVAFYIGIAMSISLYLKKAAIPELLEFTMDEKGALRQIYPWEQKTKRIKIVKVEGELFFGAAELFHTTLKGIADSGEPVAIILQLKNARDMDATACLAIKQLSGQLRAGGHTLLASGMTPEVWKVFLDSAIVEEIGMENLFPFDPLAPHKHMQLAWERANIAVSEKKVTTEEGEKEPLLQKV